MNSKFLRFAIVGAAGFVVDAAVLALGLHVGLGKYLARAISFLCAATFTWAMNRRFTFPETAAASGHAREWLRFVAVNGVGGAVNYGIYAALVTWAAFPFSNPFLALAVGSLAGLVFNFLGSKFIVFRA